MSSNSALVSLDSQVSPHWNITKQIPRIVLELKKELDLAFNNVKPENCFFLSLIRFDSGQD